ncbi:HIRAN domain-containing protein [Amycolatopsis rhabdoformis]|uniref:HIRAN domain-containing protein n=1 Tax=Amycolatopsis rhabdoformis TaxID=1448059 RepID=A0ABZ1IJT1_9PSEU|nr:HIRAN domain-containing protein [Amycolatopsis rhabdoformis]WSE33983.1 HIRAN domain-containing protein [Amycolatopsis rhabdoformis]
MTAVLVPEPENKWDRQAVRVDVLDSGRPLKVGYLPRDLAAEYQPTLLAVGQQGLVGTCPARIAGGGEKFYGIYLYLARPRALRVALGMDEPFIARRAGVEVLLRNDWSCTVTQEQAHQNVLTRYAPARGQEIREVVASLGFCRITSGKYRGEEALEVRLGGERVGQVTRAMTERYGDQVHTLIAQGLTVTCEAFTKRTDKGIEIELLLPPGR